MYSNSATVYNVSLSPDLTLQSVLNSGLMQGNYLNVFQLEFLFIQ